MEIFLKNEETSFSFSKTIPFIMKNLIHCERRKSYWMGGDESEDGEWSSQIKLKLWEMSW